MGTWNSRGLRGAGLEAVINLTNEEYRRRGLALVQKIPTPITPVKIDKETRHITLAYFEKRSTVDYIGSVQGIPVCFDAKETASDTYPIENIHGHQVEFMIDFERQKGIAFIILSFTKRDEAYYVPLKDIVYFYDRAKEGGRKSFTYDEVDKTFKIEREKGAALHYLTGIQKDLLQRHEK